MKITIACVGKIKEKYLEDAIAEYLKRLRPYAQTEIIEVADERTYEAETFNSQLREKEGKRLLKVLPKESYIIALCIDGKALSSEELSEKINTLTVEGISHITFIIGGSTGLSDEAIGAADFKLSFSKMTFPHQLMRVILLEQIYRSFKIIKGEPYHK